MEASTFYHRPVLLQEAVDALSIKPSGVYVDGTFGGGGHSLAILDKLGEKGKLIVFDHDKAVWENVPKDKRVILIKENFRYLKRFLKLHQTPQVDGILVDLGVSSYQFDTAERGFSTRFDGPLDMRMDLRKEFTAQDIISKYSEKELHLIFEIYGEVRNAKTLASTIVNGRNHVEIHSISGFKSLISECIKGNPNRYLAQVFQALRIEVNDELEVLKEFLKQTPSCLNKGGRLAVITFHSLEDRIVKYFIKKGNFENKVEKDDFGNALLVHPLNSLKDMLPTAKEIKENPRAKSARLRIAEKK